MKKILMTLFATVILLSSCVTTGSVKSVTIQGTGVVRAVPDRASFDLTFTETSKTTVMARELVNEKITLALTYLAEAGVEETSIQTSRLTYRKKTRWNEGEEIFVGQEASQILHVDMELKDNVLNNLIDELTLIDGLGLGSLTFSQQNGQALEEKARELAFQNALDKAEDYARFSKLSLGGVLSLSENQSLYGRSTVSAMEAQVFSKSSSSVMTGENEISITVFAVFELR